VEFSIMLQRLWRHRVLVALGVLVAAVVTVFYAYDVSLGDRTVRSRTSSFGAAQTTMYVDTRRSSIVLTQQNTNTLVSRAQILARLIDSGRIKQSAARKLGIERREISVIGPFPDTAGQQSNQPAAQQRANQILSQGSPYSVFVDTDPNAPTIALFTQAPDGAKASRLAGEVTRALQSYVAAQENDARASELDALRTEARADAARQDRNISASEREQRRNELFADQTVIRSLGTPVGGDITDQSGSLLAGAVFVGLALAWCIVILLVTSFSRSVVRR
jgi:hypothetical protein